MLDFDHEAGGACPSGGPSDDDAMLTSAPGAEKRGGKASANKAKAKAKHKRTCLICRDDGSQLCGNNPFCHKCKAEHDAMKKDAQTHGWISRFEEGKNNPVIFRKMVNDFRHLCASRGRGRPRPVYKAANLEEMLEESSIIQKGNEYAMMDWSKFEAWYHQKKLGDEEIEAKWREALSTSVPGALDREGENPNYPERVQVLVRAFRKVYDEEARR